mmetsp:Transcript_40638/g.36085  ORF Transcript_40638/g.36085 Transcript_40638/m.36085 type:complete len:103 (+) Transcript_40638:826-1134(+)
MINHLRDFRPSVPEYVDINPEFNKKAELYILQLEKAKKEDTKLNPENNKPRRPRHSSGEILNTETTASDKHSSRKSLEDLSKHLFSITSQQRSSGGSKKDVF